jgi:RimJ/RimL family protein N-acetyltransferase
LTSAKGFLSTETLRDGRRVLTRALGPEDRAGLIAAIERTGDRSRYRRFFGFKRGFSEQEIEFYVNVDQVNHVALVAILEEGGRPAIVGGGRYIVSGEGKAEMAFTIDDEHQGQGIGTTLVRHLGAIARSAGIKELVAEVLPENVAMLKVFEKSGFKINTARKRDVIHVTLTVS